jgi:hypothetical protein
MIFFSIENYHVHPNYNIFPKQCCAYINKIIKGYVVVDINKIISKKMRSHYLSFHDLYSFFPLRFCSFKFMSL